MSIYNVLAGFSGAASFSATYVGFVGNSASNTTSDTYSSINIGTADATRILVLCISGAGSGGATGGVTSVTCNGVSMNMQVSLTTSRSPSAIYTLNVASGTTATFVINHASGAYAAELYALYNTTNGGTATSTASAYTASSLPSMTLTMPTGGAAIYTIWQQSAPPASPAFSVGTINDNHSVYPTSAIICGIYTPTPSGSVTNTVSGYSAVLASYACASFI